MPVTLDPSGRGATRWGLRIRGAATIAAIVLILVGIQTITGPDRSGQSSFTIAATSLGDAVTTQTKVRLNGVTIGDITEIKAVGATEKRVKLSVQKARLADLSTTMETRFVSTTVFGTTAIELIPRSGGQPVRSGMVLNMGANIGNYTMTSLLRDAGQLTIDVLTPQLTQAINSAADLTSALTPSITAALSGLQAVEKALRAPHQPGLLPRAAAVLEAIRSLVPVSVNVMDTIAKVKELDSLEMAQKSADLLAEVSNLVLSFAGSLFNAMRPLTSMLDSTTAFVKPLNQRLSGVSADDIRRLITGVNGAMHKSGGRVTLDTEVVITSFPAFAMPLQALLRGGGK